MKKYKLTTKWVKVVEEEEIVNQSELDSIVALLKKHNVQYTIEDIEE